MVVAVMVTAGVAGALAMGGDGIGGSGRAAIAGTATALLATSTTTTAPPATTTTRVTATTARPPATTTPAVKAATGPSISIEFTPARPKAGELVRFVVTATQPGNCCAVGLQLGDGGEAAPNQTCTAGQGGRQRVEFTHAYNRPGTWTAVARADAGRACDATDAMRAVFPGGQWNGTTLPPVTTPALPQIMTTVTVVVSPGVTVSQGPALPQFDGIALVRSPDGQVALQAVVSDGDGWLARVEVDWGDGTPATVVLPPTACRNNESGLPVASFWVLRDTATPSFVPSPTHRYATPGAYTVTITAVSTACDGSMPQRSTRTVSA